MATIAEYKVYRVVDQRQINNHVEYKVEWQHTWEPSAVVVALETEVKMIINKRRNAAGDREYKIHWQPSWIDPSEVKCATEIKFF